MPIDYHPFFKIKRDGTSRPRLLVTIEVPNTKQSVPSPAFIDTGSSYCCFPRDYAKRLKIKLRKGEKIILSSSGKKRRGRLHYLNLEIFGSKLVPGNNPIYSDITFTNDPVITLKDMPIVFVRYLQEPILGIKGFLDKYVYVVNHIRMGYSLRTPKKDNLHLVCMP